VNDKSIKGTNVGLFYCSFLRLSCVVVEHFIYLGRTQQLDSEMENMVIGHHP